MDNEGLYVDYCQLLYEMFIGGSSKVNSSTLTLSNKVIDNGGDIYDFTVSGSDPLPLIGDAITQAGYVDCIIEILSGPDRIRIEKTDSQNKIVNGPSKLLHSETIPRALGERIIQQHMDFVDLHTRQFFNKRSGTFKFEGNNTLLLHLPVPIIEIEKLLINSTDTELIEGETNDFFAFKGRQNPQDDRYNPRIKLSIGRGRDSIYTGFTTRAFLKNTLTSITGSFGFLELNGNTPPLIQRAIIKLAIKDILEPVGSGAVSSGQGPIKRLKVDLHEKEFFELKGASTGGGLSGDKEIDNILAKYRSPIAIGGSFKRVQTESLTD